MIVVADTSVILNLTFVGQEQLLTHLFGGAHSSSRSCRISSPRLRARHAQDGCDFREQPFSFSPNQEAKHAEGNEAVLNGGEASGAFIHQDKVRVQFQSQREP